MKFRNESGRAPFIVLEGVDGSGKTTQRDRLTHRFQNAGIPVRGDSEPTSGRVGKLLREYLTRGFETDPGVAAALFAADRIEHVTGPDGMLAALGRGETVLCDRYFLSSCAYQSRTLDLGWVISLNEYAIKLLPPDLTVFIDLPPETAYARVGGRGDARERFEESVRSLAATREAYLRAAALTVPTERFLTVDGDLPEGELEALISAELERRFARV